MLSPDCSGWREVSEVDDAVDFRGWVQPQDVPALLNQATLLLVPSRWQEPFGLVALEGMRMARPIVATRVGGLPEIVIPGETGLLVEREDDAGMAEAMLHLLARPTLAVDMGSAGRARARSVFSFTGMVDAYEALYRQLVDASPAT